MFVLNEKEADPLALLLLPRMSRFNNIKKEYLYEKSIY